MGRINPGQTRLNRALAATAETAANEKVAAAAGRYYI
jgi:hypothetical protein